MLKLVSSPFEMSHDFDIKLWQFYTKDVKRLKTDKIPYPHAAETKPLSKTKSPVIHQLSPIMDPTQLMTSKNNPPSLDVIDTSLRYNSPVKLARPHIDGHLDLHGMTQVQAYEKLCQFIIYAHTTQKRNVLIITGKGQRLQNNLTFTPMGVLRQMLPIWLEAQILRSYIVHYHQAKPQDGGLGAYYVKIKRIKTK